MDTDYLEDEKDDILYRVDDLKSIRSIKKKSKREMINIHN